MRRSPDVAQAALFVLILWAGAAASAGAPRLTEFPRDGVPLSGADLDADRARRAALGPNAPEVKVESGVLARSQALGEALTIKSRRSYTNLAADFSSPGLPVDGQARLYVRIDGANVAARVGDLTAMGVAPVSVAAQYGFLEAWVPYDRVTDVAALPWVRLVGLAGIPCSDLGAQESQGDHIHRADLARSTFGID